MPLLACGRSDKDIDLLRLNRQADTANTIVKMDDSTAETEWNRTQFNVAWWNVSNPSASFLGSYLMTDICVVQ